jgi:hypothetical protein
VYVGIAAPNYSIPRRGYSDKAACRPISNFKPRITSECHIARARAAPVQTLPASGYARSGVRRYACFICYETARPARPSTTPAAHSIRNSELRAEARESATLFVVAAAGPALYRRAVALIQAWRCLGVGKRPHSVRVPTRELCRYDTFSGATGLTRRSMPLCRRGPIHRAARNGATCQPLKPDRRRWPGRWKCA